MECLTDNPLKGIVRINMISAQRGFSDTDKKELSEVERTSLSSQIRGYYDKHLDPEKTPSPEDLSILVATEQARKVFDQNLETKFEPAIKELEELGLKYPLVVGTGRPLRSEEDYKGRGVSACATCDGFFYRKKTVAVVGGGDTACEEAVYLAGLAKQVYLIVRKPYLRASQIMQERVLNHPKIQVLFEHNTVGLFGDNGVEGVHLVKRKGEADEEFYDLAIDGFFLAIGHNPNSEVFKPWIETDEVGYIVTEGATPRTRVPGVFAAGDVADPHYRQAITAAGSGCKAAIEAERFLSANGLL